MAHSPITLQPTMVIGILGCDREDDWVSGNIEVLSSLKELKKLSLYNTKAEKDLTLWALDQI